LSSLHRCLHYF